MINNSAKFDPRKLFPNKSTRCSSLQDLAIEESYDALSQKTAAFHRWAAENVSFKFAFKTDDDIFVRVDRLVSALYQASTHETFHTKRLRMTCNSCKIAEWIDIFINPDTNQTSTFWCRIRSAFQKLGTGETLYPHYTDCEKLKLVVT